MATTEKPSFVDIEADKNNDNNPKNQCFTKHTTTTKGKDLLWSNVNMKLINPKKKGNEKISKHILTNVWGKAEAGKTTAIMGASGAGKTSLFQILAGRVSSGGKLRVSGDIYLGGVKINPNTYANRRLFAYVGQTDSLHQTSTPRETLRFSAKLRLPSTTTNEEIDAIVNSIIDNLGLGSAADTIIGGKFKKGISGGEKRRVSIGLELVVSPAILVLDEPTSGLDSYAAAQVMKLLDSLARAGTTVLFTIHQPSSLVFSQFDQLVLLHQGRVLHQGSLSELKDDFASKYDQPVPHSYNPADWILDVPQSNSIDDLEKWNFFPNEPPNHKPRWGKGKIEHRKGMHVSLLVEFHLLMQRELANLRRNRTPLFINLGITSFMSIIFGVIFLDIGRRDKANFTVVQSQLGAIVNLFISTLMGQSNTALFTFSDERPIFLREFSTDHYRIIPYFVSKLASEAFNSFLAIFVQTLVVYWAMGFTMSFGQLLFLCYALALTATAVAVLLGAFFENPRNAASLFTLVVVPQFYFSGLFISIDLVPGWVAWAQYICSLTYAARIGFAYEFGNCELGPAGENCQRLLDGNYVVLEHTHWYWLGLGGLFCMFRFAGIAVLHSKASY